MRISWAVTFAVLAVIVALVPGIERRWLTVGYLIVSIPWQLCWHRIRPSRPVSVDRPMMDTMSVLVCTAISPALWFPGVLIYAMGVGNIGRERIPPQYRFLLLLMGVGLAAIGWYNDLPSWLAVSLVAGVMFGLRSVVVNSVWQLVRRAENDLFDVLESISAVVHIAEPESGELTWVAPNIVRTMGYTAEEWVALRFDDVVHPDDAEDYPLKSQTVFEGQHWDQYVRHRHRDGHWVWLHMVTTARRAPSGRLLLRGHYTDASKLVTAREEIQRIARTDELTGLSNRYVLLNEMAARLNRPTPAFGLLILDVDRFKNINDSLGHLIGDEVLCELGSRIAEASENNLVCRLGGDEFAVVLDDPHSVELVAARIGALCAAPMRVNGLTLCAEVSIGSVVVPEDGLSPKDLLRRGDIAMYHAKRRHRLHSPFEPKMDRNTATELKLSSGLAQSMEDGEFEVFFQPKVDLLSGEIIGAEGLARWRHPELGMLRPTSFIHLVSLSNEHAQFTDHVVDQGARFAADAALVAGHPIPVALNISVTSLFDEAFAGRVAAAIERHGIEPSQLVLEVTEDAIMEDFATISPVIAELANLGVDLSIDDFGTGHSSLARLVDLPVREIKIDRRFVAASIDESPERSVVQAVLDLSRQLGLVAVAEGIESEAQAATLIGLGCTIGQGYLFGRAMPRTELLNRIRAEQRPSEARDFTDSDGSVVHDLVDVQVSGFVKTTPVPTSFR